MLNVDVNRNIATPSLARAATPVSADISAVMKTSHNGILTISLVFVVHAVALHYSMCDTTDILQQELYEAQLPMSLHGYARPRGTSNISRSGGSLVDSRSRGCD